MLTRRKLLLATGGIAAGAALIKPSDEGGAHSPYFARLNKTLRNNGIDTPVLVIDLDRLDRNVDRVVQSVGSTPEKNYRVVAKSIPSPQLVDYVAQRANTQSLMVFHRPFLQEMSRLNPQADILMGKPMPVAAAKTFYATPTEAFNPERQLQWLIDTNQRLNQYLQLAQSKEVKMRVNFELDVGLHRGGFEAGSELAQALTTIQNNPDYLKFAGFMGYDAHLMGLPKFLADQELPKVKAKYAACVAQLNDSFPTLVSTDVCFNGAGSPTFRHYEGDTVVNDLSVGSALMKPTHYDLPILEDFEPSAFIASPVLKQLQGSRLPAAEWVGPMLRGWNQNQEHIYFCYSGNWLAENESPPGLTPHFAYVSSNQQGYTGSDSVELEVDDFIFLRPTQSEAVLLQFGDLVVMRGDKIVDRWPVLPVSV
jgi:D-serine deaminase-like pyridoxal phosphate-dependent protein